MKKECKNWNPMRHGSRWVTESHSEVVSLGAVVCGSNYKCTQLTPCIYCYTTVLWLHTFYVHVILLGY